MDFIVADNLSHIYNVGGDNEYTALDKISFSVKSGEFVALLGGNGSGKSTLAKHINALLLPTTGDCLIDGINTKDGDNLWAVRQQIGMVFQNPDNQIVAAIVEDDVAFGPENLGVEPELIATRVTNSLETVGMLDFRKFSPHLLSGGQKQRIAIAGALAMQTKCLLLDEPTAMLDPQGREEVLATVRHLNKKMGITILYITHFMEEAAVADRIIVLDKGKIVEDGTPLSVFDDVERMKRYGLNVPLPIEIAWSLKKRGVRLPENILTDEDLVEALCQ